MTWTRRVALVCLLAAAVLPASGCFGIAKNYETGENLLADARADYPGVAVRVASYDFTDCSGRTLEAMDSKQLVSHLVECGWQTKAGAAGTQYSVAIKHANIPIRFSRYGGLITYNVLVALPALVSPVPIVTRMDRCVEITVCDENGNESARRWTVVDHKIIALSIWASVGLIGRANSNIQEYTAVLTTQMLNQVLSRNAREDARQTGK